MNAKHGKGNKVKWREVSEYKKDEIEKSKWKGKFLNSGFYRKKNDDDD